MSFEIPFQAKQRLRKDYMELIKDPVPYITAHPLEENILEWHYVLKGPEDSPYRGGIYHGTIQFPKEFPYKPPAIKMLTPNGRFFPNKSICLSMSEYHPETWSPLWTVSAVLNGLLSFMLTEEKAAGSIVTSIEAKQKYAKSSWAYNLEDKTFCKLFPDLAEEAKTKNKT
jgi:ubiquitin-conjugating enzyme E2 J2